MADPIDLHVGMQIRLRRIAKRMSQAELANAVGLSLDQLHRYERAKERVRASMLDRIARCLGVSPASLFADFADAKTECRVLH